LLDRKINPHLHDTLIFGVNNLEEHPMSTRLPDIGHVTTAQVDGLEIRLARSCQAS
jgi:hypothetical protein